RHRGRWGFLCVRNGRYPERNPGGAAGQQSGDDTNSNAFVHAEILPIPEDESAASSPQSVGTASDIPGNGHSFRAIGAAFAVRWTAAAVVAPRADGWRVQPGWPRGSVACCHGLAAPPRSPRFVASPPHEEGHDGRDDGGGYKQHHVATVEPASLATPSAAGSRPATCTRRGCHVAPAGWRSGPVGRRWRSTRPTFERSGGPGRTGRFYRHGSSLVALRPLSARHPDAHRADDSEAHERDRVLGPAVRQIEDAHDHTGDEHD